VSTTASTADSVEGAAPYDALVVAAPATVATATQPVYSVIGVCSSSRSAQPSARGSRSAAVASTASSATMTICAASTQRCENSTTQDAFSTPAAASHHPVRRCAARSRWPGSACRTARAVKVT
jgi:hypothetical protein